MQAKRLVLRLSSLGDIILASTALEVQSSPDSSVDWVVAEEFAELLKNHPKIQNIIEFNRKSGFKSWIQQCRKLWDHQYEEVFDLHKSLRTRVMRLLFFYWGIAGNKTSPRWRSITKQRLRLYFVYLFKGYCPRFLQPQPWIHRFAQALGGNGNERPNLKHLLKNQILPPDFTEFLKNNNNQRYLCVMPSSKWGGKKWPVDHYVETLVQLKYLPVVLGSKSDVESSILCEKLSARQFPHFSGVGKWNLTQTAAILAHSGGYLGGDTGLAHLAEALRIPAHVIFGPTVPKMGFAPWMKESRTIGLDLWCRPCGKDGRYCYRPVHKYKCLKDLKPEAVLKTFGEK